MYQHMFQLFKCLWTTIMNSFLKIRLEIIFSLVTGVIYDKLYG